MSIIQVNIHSEIPTENSNVYGPMRMFKCVCVQQIFMEKLLLVHKNLDKQLKNENIIRMGLN